ncbi:hypothetical protein ACTA71_005574 [Dictyostelium dimigraforme]
MASSVASVIGTNDQCSYICSNNVLDSLSKYRKSIGLPSTCINFGSVGEVGYVSRFGSIGEMISNQGILPISSNLLLGSLDLIIQNPQISTNIIVCSLNLKEFKKFPTNSHQKFDFNLNSITTIERISFEDSSNLNDKVINKISEFLSIEPSKLNIDLKLLYYGGDSLLAVRLKNFIDNEYRPNIISIQQIQNSAISTLVKIINLAIEAKKKKRTI